MSQETKTALAIIIREIRDAKGDEAINEVLDSWIKANDLHPEKVRAFKDTNELNKYLESVRAPFRINDKQHEAKK
jgi:hypothetical protein